MDSHELMGNVIPTFFIFFNIVFTESILPLRIDGRTHKQTVQPHLIGINGLVEEATGTWKTFGYT